MLNQKTHKICVDFINDYFPSAKHVILSGSQATNKQSENSDYDIIILEKDIDKFKSERIIYSSRLFDVMVIPIEKIDDIVLLDHKDGHGIFTGMLSKGVVVIDHDDVASSLISLSRKRFDNGVVKWNMDFLHKLKIQVQDYLDDLEGVSLTNDGAYLIILNLVTKYMDFVLYYHGLWKGNSKINYRQLERIEPNFNFKLQEAISKFFCLGDKSLIVETIKQQMYKYGSQKTLNISGATGNYINEDYFVLKVLGQDDDIFVTMDKLKSQINKLLKLLGNPETYWFFVPNNLIKGESLINQIYLIIFQDQGLLNKNTSFISKRLAEISDNSTSYYGPLNLDISLIFSPCFSSFTFRDLIHQVCKKLLLQKNASKSTSILMALEVNHYMASLSTKFIEFNNYLFECWFPSSFDMGTHSNVEALLISKKKKYKEFTKTFHSQKESFSNFFNELQNVDGFLLDKSLKDTIHSFHKLDYDQETIHPFHLTGFGNNISHSEKKGWYRLKVCLDSILGSLLIEEVHKSYFPFALNQLYQFSKN
ncbi:nucleotidyltransferase domain-containing protein [Flagellimonas onchidii]|uniref:nucleotidyltransferase domain-containing protein n=1 Tax=Flagellimonas onchidii TaxID=2562684 RepID=UPI0010A5F167|nr:nucleotidyltransferase domain-containing protein [Allomuricauda onchidii]